MTDLRTAAQQALEALEAVQLQNMGPLIHPAKQALKAALAEPPKPASLKRGTTGRCTRKVCECEKEGLGLECIHLEPVVDGYPLWSGIPKAEPVQEPIGFVNAAHLQGLTLGLYGYAEIYVHDSVGRIPLYTSVPPQRKPLTEEDIQAAWDSVDMRHPRDNETRIAFARAIETAHEIGGQP